MNESLKSSRAFDASWRRNIKILLVINVLPLPLFLYFALDDLANRGEFLDGIVAFFALVWGFIFLLVNVFGFLSITRKTFQAQVIFAVLAILAFLTWALPFMIFIVGLF